MKKKIGQVSTAAILLAVCFAWGTWATTATMYFSSDQYGQNRITNIQEGDRIWIAVYDPDENIDCDFRDKIFPDISLMDPKTGALFNWNNSGDLSGDYLKETSADSGLFVSNQYFRIGGRANVTLKNWTHTPGDLVDGAYSYSGGVYSFLSVTGRVENMDTVYGMYQDHNDSTDIAVTMAKLIDTKGTISWDQLVYLDSHGSAKITIVDPDENLYPSEIEKIPVFIIVNPGSWNPVRENSPTNFCMLKRCGGIDPVDGSVMDEPIRWYNIYNSGLGGPYPNNTQPVSACAYYMQYPVSGNVTTFDTTDPNGYCRVMFYAQETGFDTGVFELRLDHILSGLGFNSLKKRDTLVAYYLDPNDTDDFKLATAYIEEAEHSVTSFVDESHATKSVYQIGRNPVYVQVIDSNANVDCCGDPEQIVTHICDPHGEDDSEWIILDETSSNSPIFFTQAKISLLPAWNALGLGIPGPGGWQLQLDNWKLEAYNEDSIYVRYNDVYYTQNAIDSLGDSNSNTAFPPEIAAVRVSNDVSFDTMQISDTQVFDGSSVNMYFLDRRGNQVTSYVNSDCALIEVIDPDQNEDPLRRDRIYAYWDGGQDLACAMQTPDIFGNPARAKVYVVNPRNGHWAAVDLLETGVGTGNFVSVTGVDLISQDASDPTHIPHPSRFLPA